MRKTQVALAALALMASTAALAEVTLYGGLDMSIRKTANGSTGFNTAGDNGISLIGIKATEDLGGGLTMTAVAEGGFNFGQGGAQNGGVASGLFNRQTNISLGNDMVTVTGGMQISPFINAALGGADNGVGGNGVFVPVIQRLTGGNLANVFGSGTAADSGAGGFFIPEAVSASINLGGATLTGLTKVGKGAQSYSAGSITTSFGGVNLSAGYQSFGMLAAANQSTDSTNPYSPDNTRFNSGITNYVIGANTNIGDIRLTGAWGNSSGGTDINGNAMKGNGYMVGASMPLVGALSGGLTYAKTSMNDLGSQTSASLKYSLSKATYMYGTYTAFGNELSTAAGMFGGNHYGGGKHSAMVGINTSF